MAQSPRLSGLLKQNSCGPRLRTSEFLPRLSEMDVLRNILFQTVDYRPFIKRPLASTLLNLRTYAVQIRSHCQRISWEIKPLQRTMCWDDATGSFCARLPICALESVTIAQHPPLLKKKKEFRLDLFDVGHIYFIRTQCVSFSLLRWDRWLKRCVF